MIGGDIGLGKLFEEVERGIVNVDRNIDIFFLIVVTRHLTNDSISWKSHFALFGVIGYEGSDDVIQE